MFRHCYGCDNNITDIPGNWRVKAKHQLTGLCRECSNKRHREFYNNNKDKVLAKNNKYRKEHKEYFRNYQSEYRIKKILEES